MKKYNFKKDLKNIFRIFFSALTIISLFVIFSFVLLLPIYLVSKYYPKTYSIIISLLIVLIILIIIIKKMLKIWKKYKKINLFIYHILFYFLIPPVSIIFLIIFESVLLRIFYRIFNFINSTIFLIIINIVILFLIFFIRKIIHNFKLFLKENQIKDIT